MSCKKIIYHFVIKLFLYGFKIFHSIVVSITHAYTYSFRKQVRKALFCNQYKLKTTKYLLNLESCEFVKAFLFEKSCQEKVVTTKCWNHIKRRWVTKKRWTLRSKYSFKIKILIQTPGKFDPSRNKKCFGSQ